MDITGARWGLDGAEAVLRLRALISAGDFDTYWTWHLTREHHRTHLTHYQDHTLAACPGSLQKSRTRSIRHPGTPTILSQGAVAQPRFRPLGGSRQRPCRCRWRPLPMESAGAAPRRPTRTKLDQPRCAGLRSAIVFSGGLTRSVRAPLV
jgi:hypothetical protein